MLPAVSTVALGLGITGAVIEGIATGQLISPLTIAGAAAVLKHNDCFDVWDREEVGLALLLKEAPNKSQLYRTLALAQAEHADYTKWSVNFHTWIGLTGIDDADSTVRETFREWFRLRQARPQLEIKGTGSQSIFSSAVATLAYNDVPHERTLMARIDQAVLELYRHSYFDPQLPTADSGETECCLGPHRLFRELSSTPYSPLDLFVGSRSPFGTASAASRPSSQ